MVDSFTREQLKVIENPANARIMVEAGPGTGKTAVACRRVAYIIEHEQISPSEVLIVSFTRAAIIEIRERISSYLADPSAAASVAISTIDSFAFRVRRGFGLEAPVIGDYSDGIKELSELLATNPQAREYINSWKHVVIDEAQDIVSPRAEAILDILHFLNPDCGVTILCDQAQAIYTFAEEGEGSMLPGNNLPNVIDELASGIYTKLELTKVHRTSDKKLLKFLSKGREMLREEAGNGTLFHKEMIDLIRDSASDSAHKVDELEVSFDQIPKNALVLFRTRAEVLAASSWLKSQPHRLRLSKRPTTIHPWVGILFGDIGLQEINQEVFKKLWAVRLKEFKDISSDEAWSFLVRHAGETQSVVSLKRLAKKLSSANPPEEFCLKEFGHSGPILGTVHASKGREADDVYLYLPKSSNGDAKEDLAEARVMFVGASRAKTRLFVGDAQFKLGKRTRRMRSFSPSRGGAQVEFGLGGDISPEGLVGTFYFEKTELAEKSQEFLRLNAFKHYGLEALRQDHTYEFAYQLNALDKKERIGFLDKSKVNPDLFSIRDAVRGTLRSTPAKLPYLYSLGSFTMAIDPDSPFREDLLKPWSDSYFVLAPMLVGYPKLFFSWSS